MPVEPTAGAYRETIPGARRPAARPTTPARKPDQKPEPDRGPEPSRADRGSDREPEPSEAVPSEAVPSEAVPTAVRRVAGAARRRGVMALAGVVALTAALAGACADEPPAPVGGAEASRLAGPAEPAGSGVPVQPGAAPSAAATIEPTQLKIGKLGLTARVDPVGIDARTGDFAVPPSIDVVGWYRYGPGLEAGQGSIVVAGHVDSAEQGKGAFFKLRELAPGDPVAVTGSDGAVHTFAVVSREIYAKSSIPLDRYFARDGAVRLTLITCGGPFDPKTRHYRDNVVITAQPVAG